MLADVMSATNVGLGLLLTWLSVRLLVRSQRQHQPGRWLFVLWIMTGLYWAGLYVWVLFARPGAYDPVWFGEIFVLPALTWTLAVFIAGVILKVRAK